MNVKNFLTSASLCLLSGVCLPSRAQNTLSITSPAAYVVAGEKLQLTAVATGPGTTPGSRVTIDLPNKPVWDTDDHTLATVDTGGLVTGGAIAGKPINITVTDPSGKMTPGSYTVLVTPGTPDSIQITPLLIQIGLGGTMDLSITYKVKGANTVYPLNVGLKWGITTDKAPIPFEIGPGNVLSASQTQTGVAAVTVQEEYFPTVTSNTVAVTVTAPNKDVPQFAEMPKGGNSFINIFGRKGQKLVLCEYDVSSTYVEGEICKNGTMIQFIPSGTGATPTYTMLVTDDGQAILTLARPLVAGTDLYLVNVAAAPFLSATQAVNDPNDFGRFRTYMTIGAQITNQQPSAGSGTTQSSTAGEYLEVGLMHSFFSPTPRLNAADRPPKSSTSKSPTWHPGAAGVFDVRLSPVPVSAPATMTVGSSMNTSTNGTTTTTTTSNPTISSLNLLSSQQSVRVVSQLAAPFWVRSWQGHYNVTTLSPLAKAGFMTLLNPTNAGTNTAGSLITTNFSPAYSFFGFGGRLAWERIPANPDKAPRMITKLDVTLAKYSNLPSYLCTNDKTKLGPTTTTTTDANGKKSSVTAFSFPTACGQAGGSQAANGYISKTLAYRLDIEALAKLPNYPFVLGVMANLAQYTVGHNANIDYLNKPGNDIRIFIGLTVPLSSLGSLLTTGTTGK